MNQITFTPELASYKRKDNTQNIFIRITQAGKHKRINIGYAIEKKDWNSIEQCVRRTHSLSGMLNDLIRIKIVELEKTVLKTKLEKTTISAKQLQQAIKYDILGEDFFKYSKVITDRISNFSTKRQQECNINFLRKYLGSDELSFGEINYEFLEKYKAYLKNRGDATNTIYTKMKVIRSHYNKGVKAGLYHPKVNPFLQIELGKAKSKRVRLSELQIQKIEELVLDNTTKEFHARNLFMLAFLHWGVRISDMLMMKYENINDGRLSYMAKKTIECQKIFNIKIHPRATTILEFYLNTPHKRTDFIFPFLEKLSKNYSEEELHNRIHNATFIVNKKLVKIAEKLDIPQFSSNSARHSFAEITKNKLGNKKIVTEALGHSSEKTTESYFASAAEYKNDELSDSVY